MNNFNYTKKPLPTKLLTIGVLLFLVGAIILVANYIFDSHSAPFNSLIIYVFLVSIGVGSLGFVITEYIAGAVWSVPFRRIAEYCSNLNYLLPLLVIPVLFGIHTLFHWSHTDVVETDKLLKGKSPYLNTEFFIIRAFAVAVLWIIFTYFINRNSKKQDTTADQKLTTKNIKLSAIFIPIFILTLTIVAIDYLMSLEPHWFSTIIGFYYFSGTVLAALSVITIIAVMLNEKGYLVKGINEDHYYSLGALLFAFVNFWAYIAFSQFILIWYANIPEETFWYIMRWEGSWKYATIFLVFIHFLIPYFMLVSQPSKKNPKRLIAASVVLLFAHYVDLYWLAFPTLSKEGITLSLFELSAPLVICGIIIIVFYLSYKKKNAIAIGDPKLKRGLDFRL